MALHTMFLHSLGFPAAAYSLNLEPVSICSTKYFDNTDA